MFCQFPTASRPKFADDDAGVYSAVFLVVLHISLNFSPASPPHGHGQQEAWIGHPHLNIFDNSTGFEGKMQRVVDAVGRLVGLPQTRKHVSKYLISELPDFSTFPVKVEEFEVCCCVRQSSVRLAGEQACLWGRGV